jgi:hypothetical protein
MQIDLQQTLPWLVALVAAGLFAMLAAGLLMWRSKRTVKPKALPTEWAISARPVFSTDERRVYRQLREALPHHIVLSKLPLVRFCQPNDPQDVRFWYDLLGGIHVTFAICSANGRVLAAIDLDTDRGNSRRVLQIKQSVLGACRVRYLRCPVDHLPSIPELQLLVPHSVAASRGPQAAPPAFASSSSRDSMRRAPAAPKRAERAALWQDSGFFQDSFFAPDNRLDVSGGSGDFGSPSSGVSVRELDTPLPEGEPDEGSATDGNDDAGSPRYGSTTRH